MKNKTHSRVLAGLLLLAAAWGMQGCAVKTGPRGDTLIGLDSAELFGAKVDTFLLPDAGTGSLRLLNKQYSLKIDKFFKVIPISQALTARIVKVEQVGDRTNVLVEKAENGCNYKYQLFSIKGADVLNWDFYGDCNAQAATLKVANEQQFDFALRNQVTRFTYRDSRLFKSEIALARPAASLSPVAVPAPVSPGPRNASGSPASGNGAATTAPGGGAARTQAVARPTAPPRPVVAPPPLPAKLDFPVQEQKAVRIVLDK